MRTKCIRGHSLNDINTYVSPSGARYCRTCRSDFQKVRYTKGGADAEKRNEKRKQWKKKNPEKIRIYQRKNRYGLTNEEYKAMLDKQNSRCKICERFEKLEVDHEHASHKVRGLLCGNCNRGIGLFRDQPKLLQAAATYLERAAH